MAQEETENLSRALPFKDSKSLVKNIPKQQKEQLQIDFTVGFHQTFKKEIKLFEKIEEEGSLPNSPYKVSRMLILKPDKDITKNKNYRAVSFMNIDTNTFHKILAN